MSSARLAPAPALAEAGGLARAGRLDLSVPTDKGANAG